MEHTDNKRLAWIWVTLVWCSLVWFRLAWIDFVCVSFGLGKLSRSMLEYI